MKEKWTKEIELNLESVTATKQNTRAKLRVLFFFLVDTSKKITLHDHVLR